MARAGWLPSSVSVAVRRERCPGRLPVPVADRGGEPARDGVRPGCRRVLLGFWAGASGAWCLALGGQGWRMRSSPRWSTATVPVRLSRLSRLARSLMALVTDAADWSARRSTMMPAWLPGG